MRKESKRIVQKNLCETYISAV